MPNSDDGIFIDARRFFFHGSSSGAGAASGSSVLDEEHLRRYDAGSLIWLPRFGRLAAPGRLTFG